MAKEKIVLYVDPDVKEVVQFLADEDERSVNSYVNKLLKTHIQERETD